MSALFNAYLDTLLQQPTDSGAPAPPAGDGAVSPATGAAPPALDAVPAAPPAGPPEGSPRPAASPVHATDARPGETLAQRAVERWLIFHLSGQSYAFKVSELQEVLAWQSPTAVPQAPLNVLGLIHRRGTIVVVVDTRPALGLPSRPPPPAGAMVLLPSDLALAVDAIGDVFVPGSDEQPWPSVGGPTPAIRGLSHHDGTGIILLDATALAAAVAEGGMTIA